MKKTILLLITYILILGCSSEKSTSQSDTLFGKWKLISFVDTLNGTTIVESDFENTGLIFVVFNNDFSIMGDTSRNDLGGKYALNDSEKLLIFLEFYTNTEVGETDWGDLFFDKLRLNYEQSSNHWINNYELSDGVLKIYYSENEYMKFMKM